ncbi:MAG: hypothetical protein QOK09_3768 [Mycobacterium sp.]|jgi:hypothetical protein|nr:hypothetical protein [Mycobacterium sp.]MDT7740399.1 hypothetical protein [Mycobacterium sp.]
MCSVPQSFVPVPEKPPLEGRLSLPLNGLATDLDTEHGGTDANKRDGATLNARLFGILLRLPPQAFGLIFSHEWFVDPTAAPKTRCSAIFD